MLKKAKLVRDRQISNVFIHIPLWVYPALAALVLMPVSYVNTSPDASWYLSNGLNIYQGKGYDVTLRGPMFPLLLAASFHLFGVSVWAGMFVVRLFFVLDVLLIYALATRLFNPRTGLIASLLALSSYAFTYSGAFLLLDLVFPFFALIGVWASIQALERRNVKWAVIAGVALALGFLTKEVALLFVGFPLGAWLLVRGYRTKNGAVHVCIILTVFVITVTPWAIHVYQVDGTLKSLLGFAMNNGSVAQVLAPNQVSAIAVLHTVLRYTTALIRYFKDNFYSYFALWPLVLLSWASAVLMALKDKSNRLLIIMGAPFLPMMLFQGEQELRLGQGVVLFMITYVAMAAFIEQGTRWLLQIVVPWLQPQKYVKVLSMGVILITLVCVTVQLGEGTLSQWSHQSLVVRWLLGKDTSWKVSGWHQEVVREAAKWLRRNLSPMDRVWSDWSWKESIYFYTEGKINLVELKSYSYSPLVRIYGCQRYDEEKDRPIFIWTQANRTNPYAVNSKVFVVLERCMLKSLRELEVNYVVVTARRNFFSLYFQKNDGFEEVARFGKGAIKVFKVHNPKPLDEFPLHVSPSFIQMLKNWSQSHPGDYRSFLEDFFFRLLRWDFQQLQAFFKGEMPLKLIQLYRVYP